MNVPAIDETCVVECRSGIEHVLVHVIMNGHIHCLLNHLADMVFPMGFIKNGIARNYLILNILHKFLIQHIHRLLPLFSFISEANSPLHPSVMSR